MPFQQRKSSLRVLMFELRMIVSTLLEKSLLLLDLEQGAWYYLVMKVFGIQNFLHIFKYVHIILIHKHQVNLRVNGLLFLIHG